MPKRHNDKKSIHSPPTTHKIHGLSKNQNCRFLRKKYVKLAAGPAKVPMVSDRRLYYMKKNSLGRKESEGVKSILANLVSISGFHGIKVGLSELARKLASILMKLMTRPSGSRRKAVRVPPMRPPLPLFSKRQLRRN